MIEGILSGGIFPTRDYVQGDFVRFPICLGEEGFDSSADERAADGTVMQRV